MRRPLGGLSSQTDKGLVQVRENSPAHAGSVARVQVFIATSGAFGRSDSSWPRRLAGEAPGLIRANGLRPPAWKCTTS